MSDEGRGDPAIPKLADIRGALEARGTRPNRRFGQNFLTDPGLLRRIVADAEVGEGDVVLEVGPGPGALTAALLQTGARVVAVEVDRGMRSLLAELLGAPERLEVIATDILSGSGRMPREVEAALGRARAKSGAAKFLHVANLPYQVAATWIADLVWDDHLERALVTIQREVADRLTAAPGSSAYGPLSMIVQLRARVSVTRKLARGAFWPPPKVESAVVRIERVADLTGDLGPRVLRDTVRGLFAARRKRAARSMTLAFPDLSIRDAEAVLVAADIDPGRRGETVSPREVVRLARALEDQGIARFGSQGES